MRGRWRSQRKKSPRNYVIFYEVERGGKNFYELASHYNISYSRVHQIYAFVLEESIKNPAVFADNFKKATGFQFS